MHDELSYPRFAHPPLPALGRKSSPSSPRVNPAAGRAIGVLRVGLDCGTRPRHADSSVRSLRASAQSKLARACSALDFRRLSKFFPLRATRRVGGAAATCAVYIAAVLRYYALAELKILVHLCNPIKSATELGKSGELQCGGRELRVTVEGGMPTKLSVHRVVVCSAIKTRSRRWCAQWAKMAALWNIS